MYVQALWRYPVTSMRGQRLERAELRPDGIAGDRLVRVVRGDRVLTARTHPRLLGLQGGLGADGTPLVDGRPWDGPAAAAAVAAIGGPSTRLVFDAGLDRYDVLPLLVATDGAIAALGEVRRRLRSRPGAREALPAWLAALRAHHRRPTAWSDRLARYEGDRRRRRLGL
jgi:hypothetical protein